MLLPDWCGKGIIDVLHSVCFLSLSPVAGGVSCKCAMKHKKGRRGGVPPSAFFSRIVSLNHSGCCMALLHMAS